jgi:hypothetical protein
MTNPGPTKILKTSRKKAKVNFPQSLGWVKQTYGKGRWRQAVEMLALALSPSKLTPVDYFAYGLFRPEMTRARQREYLSSEASTRWNRRLSPESRTAHHGLLVNKVLTALVLGAAGFPVPETIAIHAKNFDVPNVPKLPDAAAIAAYLGDTANLPCFGKPVGGSLALGAASYVATDGESVTLGDGRKIALRQMAEEIATAYPDGYMFQRLIDQGPVMQALVGPALASLRVVTLRLATGTVALYAALKMPAKGAMVDASSDNGFAFLDMETGRIIRAQNTTRYCTTPLERSMETDMPLVGAEVPGVAKAVDLARRIHAMFPEHGLIGFDIAWTDAGLLVTDVNTNPFHYVYQKSADRGLLNSEFLPLLLEAEAETKRLAAFAKDRVTRIG